MRVPNSLTAAMFALACLLAAPARAQLPDFTGLVEANAPAVVNITARKSGGDAEELSELYGEDMPELFRRFFGDPNDPRNPHRGLDGRRPDSISGGSGFVISRDGYLLTNHHVVDGATEVVVRLKDRREFTAKVIGSDAATDVALLKVEASDLPVLVLGESKALKPGQWVVAIGSPFGLDFTVTAGIVSAVGRTINPDQRYVPFIQTDVAINRGNSGGPLFNLQGEVVGINSQIFSNTGGSIGVSFAIPIEVARSVAEQLRTKGKVSRGSIGVQIQRIDRDTAEALGLPKIGGALVAQVVPGSAAERAGVKVQDVILGWNGAEVSDSNELPPLVGATAPGSRATLRVWRDGKTLDLPVTVGELPPEDGEPEAARPEVAEATNPLGIGVRDLSADEREELGLGADEGVLVEDVSGAVAARAGLQPGDVILMVGRVRVGTAAAFQAQAGAAKPGQSVMLLVRRGDASSFLALRLPPAD
ncbi:MAG: DegQ family serine endoprotease [Xanthomonadales bacterium]|nr:DegQ family serine endoprotease [Xanthomonadales bacterium]MBP6691705.1 DegQ family serine endoprotease [Xanthomonadales bacterium]MBP7417015.1 DegQ family serine endoprotease [Xanthomonadales bacterium]